MSNHAVAVCDFSHETCDSRIVIVCHFVFEAYMIHVAYEILLIFIGYYCLVFLWTVYVGVTLWWSITPEQVVISSPVFFMRTGYFHVKYNKIRQSFSHEKVFNTFFSKIIHLKYLILPPFSLFSYAEIFHVNIKIYHVEFSYVINIAHMMYFLKTLCWPCVMQQSSLYWGCTGGKCKFVEAWLGDDFTLPSPQFIFI